MMGRSDPSEPPSAPTSAPTTAPGPLPERLGQRFALGELIGRGTCSEVYRAHDLLLDRDAAVKIFPVADDPRIEREVSLTASMDHPNLVPVYDVGGVNGRAFVVMALLEGGNLSDRLADGPLPLAETLLAVAAVADALGHVHRAGVLHRDVTPRNVLFDGDGRAHLSDFGVAFVADAPRITDTGIVVGSAPYLAPEQVRGEAVGPPADVYALGLVMIEALTGRPAYEGAPLAAARARLERRPEVPEGLDFEIVTLLEAMTADDPAHRPPAENVCTGLRRAALAAETLPANGAPVPFAGLGLPGLLPEATTDTFVTAGAAGAAATPAATPDETPGREPRPALARSGGLVIAASVAAAVLLAGGVVVASAWTVDSVAASAPPAATLAPPTAEIVADPGPGSLVGRGSGRSEARDEDRGSRGDDEPVTVRRGAGASQRAAATTSTDGGAASAAPRGTTSAAPTTETSPEPTRETSPETSSSEPTESTGPSAPSLVPGLPVPSVSLPLPTGTSSTTEPTPSSSSATSSSTTSSAAPSSTAGADTTSSAPASSAPASSRTEASSDAASSTTTSPAAPRRAAALTDPAVEALGEVLGSR